MYALFLKGGPLMWPLLACSVVALTVIIERLVFWLRLRGQWRTEAVEDIIRRAEQGDFDGARRVGEATGDVAAVVLAAGLAQRDHGLGEAMQVAAEGQIARMKRGLSVLDTIITLAPLLGILGTVLGIIQSFDLLGSSGIDDPKAVTGGIAQALITTAAGLAIAIVTVIPFNYLTSRVQIATKHLENTTTRFEVACRKGLGQNHAAP